MKNLFIESNFFIYIKLFSKFYSKFQKFIIKLFDFYLLKTLLFIIAYKNFNHIIYLKPRLYSLIFNKYY